tara:strand:- start:280 stop:642 length:363 start_codon:yes stop_codon:yes gene_type:complete
MTTEQKIKGTIELDFAGKKRNFKLDFLALSSIEQRLNQPLLKVVNEMTSGNIGMTNMAIIIDEALRSAGGKYTYEAVGNLILKHGFTNTFEIISKLMAELMGTKKEDPNPLEETENQKET